MTRHYETVSENEIFQQKLSDDLLEVSLLHRCPKPEEDCDDSAGIDYAEIHRRSDAMGAGNRNISYSSFILRTSTFPENMNDWVPFL